MISGEKKDVWVVKSGQLQSVTREGEIHLLQKMYKGSQLSEQLR